MRIAPQHVPRLSDRFDVLPDTLRGFARRIGNALLAMQRCCRPEIIGDFAITAMGEKNARHLGAMQWHGMATLAAQHARALRLNVVHRHAIAPDNDREIDAFMRQHVKALQNRMRKRNNVGFAARTARE